MDNRLPDQKTRKTLALIWKLSFVLLFVLLIVVKFIITQFQLSEIFVADLLIIIALLLLLPVGLWIYFNKQEFSNGLKRNGKLSLKDFKTNYRNIKTGLNWNTLFKHCPVCHGDLSLISPTKQNFYVCPQCKAEIIIKRDWTKIIFYEAIIIIIAFIVYIFTQREDLILLFAILTLVIYHFSSESVIQNNHRNIEVGS